MYFTVQIESQYTFTMYNPSVHNCTAVHQQCTQMYSCTTIVYTAVQLYTNSVHSCTAVHNEYTKLYSSTQVVYTTVQMYTNSVHICTYVHK